MDNLPSPSAKRQLLLRSLDCDTDDIQPLIDAIKGALQRGEHTLASIMATVDAARAEYGLTDEDSTIESPLEASPVESPAPSPVVTPSRGLKRPAAERVARRYAADVPQEEMYYCPYSVERSFATVFITTKTGQLYSGDVMHQPSTSRARHGHIDCDGARIPFIARLVDRKSKRMVICIPVEHGAQIDAIGIESGGVPRLMLPIDGPHRKFMGCKYEDILL